MFSNMFHEFTRECFFSPLMISFFGGDISNVNITEDSPCSFSPPSLSGSAAQTTMRTTTTLTPGVSETRSQTTAVPAASKGNNASPGESTGSFTTKAPSSTLDMPIDMQGELWYQNKQSTNGTNDQWKKRYFSTDSNGSKAQLYMWKDESKGTLLNSLDLSNFKVEHKAQPTMSMLGLGSKTPASMILIGEEDDRQEIIFRGKSNHEVHS